MIMGGIVTVFLIIVAILVVLTGWYIATFNGIRTSEIKVSEALSGIDVVVSVTVSGSCPL